MGLAVALPTSVAAPRIQRVIHHHAVRQHLVVVGEVARQAKGDGQQAGRLGGEVKPVSVGGAHDDGEVLQAGVPYKNSGSL